MYKTLEADKLVLSLTGLHERIGERFPESGLRKVCAELIETGRHTALRATQLAAPNWPLRAAVGFVIAAGALAQVLAARFLHLEDVETNIGLLQSLEAAVNLLILFAGAVWFMMTLEERLKRQRTLDELHKLRSLAHIIDMHQLTKDPAILMDESRGPNMKKPDLLRYLDHCADMLALVGKLAALYAERVRDPVVIEAVTEIENLTTGLSRKVWQKITIVGGLQAAAPSSGAG